jgi:hypothetical protein
VLFGPLRVTKLAIGRCKSECLSNFLNGVVILYVLYVNTTFNRTDRGLLETPGHLRGGRAKLGHGGDDTDKSNLQADKCTRRVYSKIKYK